MRHAPSLFEGRYLYAGGRVILVGTAGGAPLRLELVPASR